MTELSEFKYLEKVLAGNKSDIDTKFKNVIN